MRQNKTNKFKILNLNRSFVPLNIGANLDKPQESPAYTES